MKVLIAGGSGFMGKHLVQALIADSHQVWVLSRKPNRRIKNAQVVSWDGKTTHGWEQLIEEMDAVINLSGLSLYNWPWTGRKKQRFRDSRIKPGLALASAIKNASHRPNVLMTVMRHEGWHAAQDCMAGSINNSMIAIIKPEESVPGVWREIVEKTYPKSAVPWEAEAKWAGLTEGMTMKALQACASGEMWNNPDYPPTPLTKEWLIKNGYKVRN